MADTTAPGRAVARARYVRVAPRKVRRVTELIKGRPVVEALAVLQFAPQAASEPVYKVVASAAANAENNEDIDPETLVVSNIYVDEGPTLKRGRARAQGRMFRIRKRTSHITVEVESVPQRQTAQRRTAGRSRGGGRAGSGRQASGRQDGTSKKATQTRSAR